MITFTKTPTQIIERLEAAEKNAGVEYSESAFCLVPSRRPQFFGLTEQNDAKAKARELFKHKLTDAKAAKSLKAASSKVFARANTINKPVFKQRPVGAIPIIPAFITGIPADMLARENAPAPARTLNIGLDLTVAGCINAATAARVLEAITAAIVALELLQIRVKLTTGVATEPHADRTPTVDQKERQLLIPVKNYDAPLPLPLLAGLCSVFTLRSILYSYLLTANENLHSQTIAIEHSLTVASAGAVIKVAKFDSKVDLCLRLQQLAESYNPAALLTQQIAAQTSLPEGLLSELLAG